MNWFEILVWVWIIVPIVIYPILLKIKVPYDRHANSSWGPMIDNHWGWFWIQLLTTISLKNPHIY